MRYHCHKIAVALALASLCVLPSGAQENKPIGVNLETIPYPFPTVYISLDIQGEALKMAYMDVKPKEPNGKTVLLLHGKNFNGAYWEQTAKDLAQAGFRVVMPDQIGFGKSSKPHRIQYSFQLLAKNTRTLLDSLDIARVHVLGHSMGGMLATRFALMYPDRTETLILENPIGLEDWKTVVPYQTVDDWYKSELEQTYDKIKNYQLTFYYDNQWKPEYERWVHMLAGWTNDIDYPRIAWNSALLYDMIFTQPVVYEFGNVQVPTLLIIGQRDRTALGKANAPKDIQQTLGNYPLLGKKTAQTIPNAQLVEIDDVGHLPHIERYDQFIAPLMKFLAAH
ncbi:Pimeloyl-ACP methyl ester carboxylesterase [Parapedobacter composti]|uniref:Pimeloyl-ACP methyl ester carboxylesterase n=1 Tax=Parapedobacter composti TaxID=623281 RepID=A0A1I1KNB0_9SPHI|nr:alpha/beta hydrolase [Parapedobacter composti]SFC61762.1 Pimeloyl-ACP methyl ester carboxylesterase [Parapedobacter composti]